jgi:hypothetical protein
VKILKVARLDREERSRRGGLIAAAGAVLGLALLGLAGCSSTNGGNASEPQLTGMKFHLSQCQQMGPNIWKCPAVDQPLCNPDYSGQENCIRVGRKGSVFVAGPATDE